MGTYKHYSRRIDDGTIWLTAAQVQEIQAFFSPSSSRQSISHSSFVERLVNYYYYNCPYNKFCQHIDNPEETQKRLNAYLFPEPLNTIEKDGNTYTQVDVLRFLKTTGPLFMTWPQ